MKILITGANGFLGHYLVQQLLEKEFTVIATGKGECRLPYTGQKNFIYKEMDFADPFSIHDVFESSKPDAVIHIGAMSKPNECELNPMKAYVVNVEGTVQLLINAEEFKSYFLFLSSDFVFSGDTGKYKEEDAARPVNYYGRTKMDAEAAVNDYEHDWAIVRTVLVYGKNLSGKKNFMGLVKDKLEKGEEFSAVDDQLRTPTYVEDLARGVVTMIEKRAKGVFHISGKDKMSPYQMANKAAEILGLDKTLLKKVTAETFSEPAKRPPRTDFIIDKAREVLGFEPISFEEGLQKTFG